MIFTESLPEVLGPCDRIAREELFISEFSSYFGRRDMDPLSANGPGNRLKLGVTSAVLIRSEFSPNHVINKNDQYLSYSHSLWESLYYLDVRSHGGADSHKAHDEAHHREKLSMLRRPREMKKRVVC